MTHRILLLFLLCFGPGPAVFANEIMFEGYYRIEISNKPVGYTILRYEFDPKSSTFTALSFLRATFGDKTVQESLKAKATDKFRPISYQYTSQVGDKLKGIDASFKGETMTLKITEGTKLKTEVYKNPKGTFLSTFLPYMLLQKKLALNQAFKYSAVAEEDGGSYWGKIWLKEKESKAKYDVFTIANDYKGEKFFSKMAIMKDAKNPDKNVRGEVLSTSSPSKNLSSQLVTTVSQATEGQLVPNKTLIAVFGNVPTGKINILASEPSGTEKVATKGSAPAASDDEPGLTPDDPTPPPKPPQPKAGK